MATVHRYFSFSLLSLVLAWACFIFATVGSKPACAGSVTLVPGNVFSLDFNAPKFISGGNVFADFNAQPAAQDNYLVLWLQHQPLYYSDGLFNYAVTPVYESSVELLIRKDTPPGGYKLLQVGVKAGADVNDLRNWLDFNIHEVTVLPCKSFSTFTNRCAAP